MNINEPERKYLGTIERDWLAVACVLNIELYTVYSSMVLKGFCSALHSPQANEAFTVSSQHQSYG